MFHPRDLFIETENRGRKMKIEQTLNFHVATIRKTKREKRKIQIFELINTREISIFYNIFPRDKKERWWCKNISR